MEKLRSLPERFAVKIEVTNSCWLWTASTTHGGYGRYSIKQGKWESAHRFSWIHFNGDIPNNLCVLHKCDVRNCVNPDHLFLGTYKDNSIDRNKKGRHFKNAGERNGRAKLTESDVMEIRRLYQPGVRGGNSTRGLGKMYGVSGTQIRDIVKDRSWKEVVS